MMQVEQVARGWEGGLLSPLLNAGIYIFQINIYVMLYASLA